LIGKQVQIQGFHRENIDLKELVGADPKRGEKTAPAEKKGSHQTSERGLALGLTEPGIETQSDSCDLAQILKFREYRAGRKN